MSFNSILSYSVKASGIDSSDPNDYEYLPANWPPDYAIGDLAFMEIKTQNPIHSVLGKNSNDHMAIFAGYNEITGVPEFYESCPTVGVWKTNLNIMKRYFTNFVFASVDTDDTTKQAAVDLIKDEWSQLSMRPKHPITNAPIVDNYQYQLPFGSNSLPALRACYEPTNRPWWDGAALRFYCSELIWGAYMNVTNGELNIDGCPSRIVEIWSESDDVTIYDKHMYLEDCPSSVVEGETFTVTLRVQDESGFRMAGNVTLYNEELGYNKTESARILNVNNFWESLDLLDGWITYLKGGETEGWGEVSFTIPSTGDGTEIEEGSVFKIKGERNNYIPYEAEIVVVDICEEQSLATEIPADNEDDGDDSSSPQSGAVPSNSPDPLQSSPNPSVPQPTGGGPQIVAAGVEDDPQSDQTTNDAEDDDGCDGNWICEGSGTYGLLKLDGGSAHCAYVGNLKQSIMKVMKAEMEDMNIHM